MTAFEKWYQANFKDNPEQGFEYLLQCITDGAKDNFVWEYMRKTGDLAYNLDTFKKVHKNILEMKE